MITKYTVRRVTVEEVEVLAGSEREAVKAAQDVSESSMTYYHNHAGYRLIEQNLEIAKRETPSLCRIDDDGICEDPIADYHYKMKQWLCEKHYKQLRETFEVARPAAEGIPA
ncbi:MAG TPA: hypothetical protein VKA83_09275 [Methylomirabilota bacterium]|nr:hypothetical protein [Methylomirabilota bacterium]